MRQLWVTHGRRAALALSAVLTAVFVLRQWYEYNDSSYVDLRVYREGVLAWLGEGSAYPRQLVPEGLAFTYPPFALFVLAPLAAVPFWLASALLVALDVALLLAILVVVVRAAPLHAVAGVRLDAAALLGPALWTEPVRTTFDYGQVNVILLALVLVDAFVLPPRWRGVGTGIAAAIKIVPAFYGLYWLLTRQWRAAVTMVLTALTATALAAVVAPSDSARYWTETLFQTQRVGPLWYTSNQSLRATYVRLLGDGTVAALLWLGSAAIVVALTIALARRRSVAGPCLATLTAVGLASLLVAPISWSHHWVWFLPACVLLAARLESPLARAALLVTVLACFAAPHWLMPHENDRELHWSALEWVAGSTYPLLALAVLPALAAPTASSRPGVAHSATTSRPSGSM